VPGILGSDEIDLIENMSRTWRQIFKIADWRCNYE
jgi:hypothetical protein